MHVLIDLMCCWVGLRVCVVVVLVLFVELYSGREHLYCLCVLLCWKGTRWMPWYAEPMKDVKGCVKPRGVVN